MRVEKKETYTAIFLDKEEFITLCRPGDRTPEYAGLRGDIQQAMNALRKVWKNLVG